MIHAGIIALMIVVTISVSAAGVYGVKKFMNRREKVSKKKKWLTNQFLIEKSISTNNQSTVFDVDGKIVPKKVTLGQLTRRKLASKQLADENRPTIVGIIGKRLLINGSNQATQINNGIKSSEFFTSDWKPEVLEPDGEMDVESFVIKGEPSETGTGSLSNRTPRKIHDAEPDPGSVSSSFPVRILSEEIGNALNDGQSSDGQLNDGATGEEAKSEYQGSVTSRSSESTHSTSSMFTGTTEGTRLSQTSMVSISRSI